METSLFSESKKVVARRAKLISKVDPDSLIVEVGFSVIV